MYEPLLFVHSWFRWIVLIAMIYFFLRSAIGWKRGDPWTGKENHFIWAFNQAFGYQVGIGLTLWLALSPMTKAGFKNPSLISESGVISFWVFQHGITMILALGAFHIGKAKSKKVPSNRRFKVYTVTFAVILILVISAIPWPGLAYGRSLFRWFL